MADKADDKNKRTVKKLSAGSRSKPKTTEKGKADDPPGAGDSVSQDASFSGDN